MQVKHILIAIVMAFVVSAVFGGVNEAGVVTNYVATGEKKAFSGGDIAGEGALIKQGGGTMTLSTAQAFRPGDLNVRVVEGGVELNAADKPTTPTLSQAIQDKITLWLASDNLTEGEVTKWYDKRETNTESPTFPYAETDTALTTAKPVYSESSKCTCGEITNTFKGVYFGGFGSGVRMALKTASGGAFGVDSPAGQSQSYPSTVFVVYGLNFNKKLGALFGTMHESEIPMIPNNSDFKYFYTAVWGPLAGVICRLDGNKIDLRSKDAVSGVHLLEVTPNPHGTDSFAMQYALMSRDSKYGKGNSGGEFINEIVWFNKQLTEAERLEVENYLSVKWLKGGARKVALTSGTSLTVNGGAEEVEERVPFAATGSGTVTKTGTSAIVVGTEVNDLNDAAPIDITAGSIIANHSLPTIKPVDGVCYSAINNNKGTLITPTAGAGEGVIVKDGIGAVRLSGLNETTTRLEVRKGVLSLTPPSSSKTFNTDYTEIPIPGNGFETNGLKAISYYDYGSFMISNWGMKDWVGTGTSFWYDYDSWTQVGSKAKIGASISAWGFNGDRPPEGTCAMAMKQNATITTATYLNIPSAGTYELSLMLWGRGVNSVHFGIRGTLIDSTGKEVADFKIARYTYRRGFIKKVLSAQVPKAGSYKLKLAGYYNYKSSWPDITCVIDDLHLYRVGSLVDTDVTWQIPNGDFEYAKLLTGADNGTYYTLLNNTNSIAGWKFEKPAGWVASTAYGYYDKTDPVGLMTAATHVFSNRRYNDAFDNSRAPRGGSVGVLFVTNATIETTFTPPAGTRYLAVNAAHWGNDGITSVPLGAVAIIGDKTNDLGRICATTYNLARRVWPVAITTDGSQAVTLRVTCYNGNRSSTGAMVDDFELTTIYDDDTELVTDGGFETVDNAKWTRNGTAQQRGYADDLTNFGLDFLEGSAFMDFNSACSIEQSVTFPKAGNYKISVYAHNRAPSWLCEPLRAELLNSDGSVTNSILTIPEAPYRWTRYEAEFKVAEAGAKKLRLRAMGPAYPAGQFICIDSLSIKAVPSEVTRTISLNPDLYVNLKAKTMLVLDFEGEAKVGRVRINGKSVYGRIDATTHPDYISGTGALYADKQGMLIIYQ